MAGQRKNLAIIMAFFSLFFILSLYLSAQTAPVLKLRFYQGERTITHEPLTIVTSSYLSPLVSASIPSSIDPEEERKQIRRVFNLLDVRLLTEAELAWTTFARPRETLTHVIRFDSREIFLAISPSMIMTEQIVSSPNQFSITVAEQMGQEKIELLNTEIIIPSKNAAILGFEGRDGTPYFLALHLLTTPGKKGPSTGGVMGGAIGPVRAVGAIKPPRLIKKVNPVYPEAAKAAGVEGIVILEVETDEQGNVVRTALLRSVPLLDQAAIDAVKQWKYEPAIIDGKPTGIIFTVTVSFRLNR